MKRASTCSRTKAAKAASISPLVLALTTWICSPIARAAGCTSLNVVSVSTSAGWTSTPTRFALGTRSCSSPSRFAVSSVMKELIPVALPPGRARLATRPSRTGSSLETKTIGIVVRRAREGSNAALDLASIVHIDRTDLHTN
jgi:hypothetical protein